MAELENDLGSPLLPHFDLVAGTSTGGLVALALAAGFSAQEVVDFYLTYGPSVFDHPRHLLGRLFRPKHDSRRLRSALSDLLGDRTLGSSSVRLIVPAYSLETNNVYIFKTPHHPHLVRDWRESMVDIAMATTAAPTYLSPARLRNTRLVDGGVWANNPALVAVAEAAHNLDVPLPNIRLLSLGTSDAVADLNHQLDRGGLVAWLRHGRSVFLRAPSTGNFHAVKYLLRDGRAVRIDPIVPSGLFQMDKVDGQRLRGLAEEAARRATPDIRPFLTHTAAKFVPYHPTE